MKAWWSRVDRVRVLITVACGLALFVLVFALFVLHENQERKQRHSEQVNYSANCAFLDAASEKHRGEPQDDGSRPNDEQYNCNINLIPSSPIGQRPGDGFEMALFLSMFAGVLSAVGILAALYVASDRRAAERGILQAGIDKAARSNTVRLANIGKTPVFLKGWAEGAPDPDGPPDSVTWGRFETVSKVVGPADDGYVDLPVNLKLFAPGQRFAVLFEYKDVFGDVWRGWCWFTKRSGRGGYARDSETEHRKY